jgi:gamma-glutamyl:cysteine ligase YbdK (ATP-grasp superfamily)
MTAREYRRRKEPWTLEFMVNSEAAIREDLDSAENIATEYGLELSKSGTYPLVIWDRAATRY